jgi:hypothetical protein
LLVEIERRIAKDEIRMVGRELSHHLDAVAVDELDGAHFPDPRLSFL